jgi:ATP-dependent Clp protease ATP-binding subunit ClpC
LKTLPYSEIGEWVIENALDEVRAIHDGWGSTEHLLLGVLAEQNGNGCCLLRHFDLEPETIRAAVERNFPRCRHYAEFPQFTPRAQRVLALARDESEHLESPVVGSEHILIALLVEGEGLAAMILGRRFGLTPEQLRAVALSLSPERLPIAGPLAKFHLPSANRGD